MVEKKSIIMALETLKLKGNEHFKAGRLTSAMDCYFLVRNYTLSTTEKFQDLEHIRLALDAIKNNVSVMLKMLQQVADIEEFERKSGITVARCAVVELYHTLTASVGSAVKFVEECRLPPHPAVSESSLTKDRLDKDLQKLYFRGASGHFAMGNYELAFDDILKAREFDPNDKLVHKLMKRIKVMKKKATAKLAKGMKKMFA